MIRLLRRLIHRASLPGPLEQARRADRLRADNRKMQQAAEQWRRCDDTARRLDWHARSFDRGE